MKELTGKYLNVYGKSKSFKFSVAEKWEELTPGQAGSICAILAQKNADRFVIGVSILAILCDKNWKVLAGLPADLKYELMPLTNFVYETAMPVNNIYPALKQGKTVWIAPASDLSNICFGEWCFADTYFELYVKTRDLQYLGKLVATLYRPVDDKSNPEADNFRGDLRKLFNENQIEARSKAASLSDAVLMATFFWYSGARQQVIAERPTVFPPASTNEDVVQEEDTQSAGTDWMNIFRDLLGPKFGTSEQLKHTNAFFVLDYLEQQQIEFKKAKASAESH